MRIAGLVSRLYESVDVVELDINGLLLFGGCLLFLSIPILLTLYYDRDLASEIL